MTSSGSKRLQSDHLCDCSSYATPETTNKVKKGSLSNVNKPNSYQARIDAKFKKTKAKETNSYLGRCVDAAIESSLLRVCVQHLGFCEVDHRIIDTLGSQHLASGIAEEKGVKTNKEVAIRTVTSHNSQFTISSQFTTHVQRVVGKAT